MIYHSIWFYGAAAISAAGSVACWRCFHDNPLSTTHTHSHSRRNTSCSVASPFNCLHPSTSVVLRRLVPTPQHALNTSSSYLLTKCSPPPNIHICTMHLITVQPPSCNTHSSSLVTLTRPTTSYSLRITDRSLQYASPCLWNQLRPSLHQPHSTCDSSLSFYFRHFHC